MALRTKKQQAFITQLISQLVTNGWNPPKAYRDAGYKPTGARQNAYALLSKNYVQKAIAEKLGPMLAAADIEGQRILKELGIAGFSDLGDVCEWDANGLTLTASKDLKPEHRRMISKVESHTRTTTRGIKNPETHTHTVVKVELHNKMKALETLARCYKLINTDKERADTPPGNITINLANIHVEGLKPEDLAPKVV